jgi:hypothetical protein
MFCLSFYDNLSINLLYGVAIYSIIRSGYLFYYTEWLFILLYGVAIYSIIRSGYLFDHCFAHIVYSIIIRIQELLCLLGVRRPVYVYVWSGCGRVVKGAGRKAKRMVLQCINGVGSNPIEGRTTN